MSGLIVLILAVEIDFIRHLIMDLDIYTSTRNWQFTHLD